MVDVAQLVESRIVIPVVVGSSPIVHPRMLKARIRFGLFIVSCLSFYINRLQLFLYIFLSNSGSFFGTRVFFKVTYSGNPIL